MKSVRAAVLACLLTVASGVVAHPASAAPERTLSVSRTTGLSLGSVVRVEASGIPPGARVRVNQCDTFTGLPDSGDCPDIATRTADSRGRLSTRVKLGDPVLKDREFGDDAPLYCRSDLCRIFLAWSVAPPDEGVPLQVLASPALEFTGSPATIAVSPWFDLPALKWVAVTGTAYGAEGHTIKVLEQSCFDMVQGSGCYGQLPVKWGKVKADGTYKVKYPAQRHLGDGTDCAEPFILGSCVLSVIVLDALGRHDDTFGVRSLGDPQGSLTFATG
jgi:hypothetical protein